MAQLAFTGKERIGRITVERFRDSIRLRWTIHRKTYSLTVGKDCRDSVKAARAKAQIIDSDITFDRFDPSLAKYDKQQSTVLEVVSTIQTPQVCLRELWDKFLADKLPHLKQKSQYEYGAMTRLLDKLGGDLSFNALKTKQRLLEITTVDQTKRLLQYISACCAWGIKHQLVGNNPYEGLSNELPKRKSLDQPEPNAFSEEEREAVIEAFKNDTRPGINYRHYANLIKFLFLTGCRPSEAVGLTWGNVADDCSAIAFAGSLQTMSGRIIRSEGSKNNKIRTVATSNRLRNLLQLIKPQNVGPETLVFQSREGKAINYDNFCKRAWHTVVDPIKPGTTPYCCRDTFITMQLMRGVPSALIADWCDTSTKMIDKHYADKLKLAHMRPID